MSGIIFARQPIFDKYLNCVGYELLFRSEHPELLQTEFEGNQATSNLLLDVMLNTNFYELVANGKAFVNFTRDLLLSPIPSSFPKEQFVIEVLENITIDKMVLIALKRLKSQGYLLALDDFIYEESYDAAIELADYIKIDVLNCNKEQIQAQIEPLKNFKGKLLAEKIETYEQFNNCIELGFTLFQGYFMCKPQLLEGKRISTDQQSALEILTLLQNPNLDYNELEVAISKDAQLGYKILRLSNSVMYASNKSIESIKDALFRIGLEELRIWASFIVLSSVDAKPKELRNMSALRAKMAEILGSRKYPHIPRSRLFMMGLFSLLDVMLGENFEHLFEKIDIDEINKQALLHRQGEIGLILADIEAYELRNYEKVKIFTLDELADALMKSLHWLNSAGSTVGQ